MTPNTAEGIKQANEKRNASKKRAIRLTNAKKKAEKVEAIEIAERERQRVVDFYERDAVRQKRRKNARARRQAKSPWASRAA